MPGPYPTSIVGQFLVGDGHVVGGSLVPSPGGVPSAQAFGSIIAKTPILQPVGGVPSARAFGVPVVKVYQAVPVSGVASARAFGAIRTNVRVPVPGVYPTDGPILNTFLCGQRNVGRSQFGRPTFYTTVFLPIGVGVSSAQAFGVPKLNNTVRVGGVFSAGQFGVPRILAGIYVGGVPSAQRFGAIQIIAGPAFIHVGGVPSAQVFGKPIVFIVYLRPEDCLDLVLQQALCTDLSLEEAVPLDLDLEPAGCN